MAPSIRKTLGVVKDQTSIGLAKVSSNMAPDLEVAIVKATSHVDEPANEKHIQEILHLTSYSRGYVGACLSAISKRLSKTRDWVVALKALMLVHRLIVDGDPIFQLEVMYATRRGTQLLNMSDFRDEAHANSWDHSAFIRTYALYLDQKLECMSYERKQRGGGSSRPYQSPGDDWRSPQRDRSEYGEPNPYSYGSNGRSSYSSPSRSRSSTYDKRQQKDESKPQTPLGEMKPERVLGKMHQLQHLLDRSLACRPAGTAKHCRMIFIALYPLIKDSFQLYADICEILAVLLDRFFDMDYPDCVKSFEAYARAAKQIDELCSFYAWCKDTGVARSSEYPEVQRITDKLLETLEEFMRDRAKVSKSPIKEVAPASIVAREEEPVPDMNSIKALPAPSDFKEEEPEPETFKVAAVQKPPEQVQPEGDLLDLREDGVSAEDQSNKLALALFQGPVANGTNGSWEAFPSANGQQEVTSAWHTPAAEPGKADWELALVETASNLSKQKATLGGGFDSLLLNGMYDQGSVRQQVSAQMLSGSASSVALPGPGKSATPVLALPAPDGTMQTIGQDPFAASLSVPPPSYVQMAEMENKQTFLTQEQLLWQQYARDGMRGQASLNKMQNGTFIPNPVMMPYGMPTGYNTTAGGSYYHNY